jgi:hypothetical protein
MAIRIYPDEHNSATLFHDDDNDEIEAYPTSQLTAILVDSTTITIKNGDIAVAVRLTEDDILDSTGSPAGGTIGAAKTYLDDVFARTAQAKPTFSSANNTSVSSGDPVNFQVTVGVADNVKLFLMTGQPAGIGICPLSGMIVGSSTSTGAHACTIYACNSQGTTSQAFTLTIT